MGYLPRLYAQNMIFVTSDMEFLNRVYEEGPRHAGIMYIPNRMYLDGQVTLAEIAAGFIHGACHSSRYAELHLASSRRRPAIDRARAKDSARDIVRSHL